MRSKLLKRDFNEELEEIAESKGFEKEAQNLLLSMLYKVDNAYNDYQTVKREVPYKEEFLENILKIVKINCKEIEIAKPNSILEKQLENTKCKILEEDKTEMSMNWNKRYRDNMEKMKSGDIYELADVVRNLSFKQKEKGLSTGEKKMLTNAKQILVSELVLAENSSKDEVEGLIENKISSSFKEFELDNIEPVQQVVNKFIPFEDNEAN